VERKQVRKAELCNFVREVSTTGYLGVKSINGERKENDEENGGELKSKISI
jgi:hypothetical protein